MKPEMVDKRFDILFGGVDFKSLEADPIRKNSS